MSTEQPPGGQSGSHYKLPELKREPSHFEHYEEVMSRRQQLTFKTFVWNPKTREFCGRTGRSWLQIVYFYIVFYLCLAGLFVGYFYGYTYFFWDDNVPRWNFQESGYRHPMLKQPGLGFRPYRHKGTYESDHTPVIEWNKDDPSSYELYVNSLRETIEGYDRQSFTTFVCGKGQTVTSDCTLSLNDLGECNGVNDENFGYRDGNPCVLLKLNRIIGWTPVPYDSNPNENLIQHFDTDYMPVTCTQETYDKENYCSKPNCFGSVKYFPREGFPNSCFPYCGTGSNSDPKHRGPFVMVKFMNISDNPIIEKEKKPVAVQCRAWARNLNARERSGEIREVYTTFSLFMNPKLTGRSQRIVTRLF